MQLQNMEQDKHNQNHAAEHDIGFLSKCWRTRMTKKGITKQLWGFGLVYEAKLLSILSRDKERWIGYEEVTGQTSKIGNYLDF